MAHEHVKRHGRHKDLSPALWVAGAVLALLIGSLVVIVLLLHELVSLALEIAGYFAWTV
jgi:hypothetical protein